MTNKQSEAVRASDQPEQAALEFVQKGEATRIEFTTNSMVGTSGKITRRLESTSGLEVGGWDAVWGRVKFEEAEMILFEDESSVIISGNLGDENIAEVIDMMESAAATVVADDDMKSEFSRDGDSGGFTH